VDSVHHMDRILLVLDTMLCTMVDTVMDTVLDSMMYWLLVMAALMSRMMMIRLELDDSSYLVCSQTDCVVRTMGSVMSCMLTMRPMCSMSSMCSMISMSSMVMVSPGSVRPGCDYGDEQRDDQTPHSVVCLSVRCEV